MKIMKKKVYLQPDATIYALSSADGLLTTFSVTTSEKASENDNPPMDVKEDGYEWGTMWE